ncbi:hypothetical protein UFOVP152_18 [uncultured Caudovirales phage]|uniref:Uncharacterized protein n=1 Tax=uncultured Caudovirales phage TaxID=2100421 RepID=A0A6J7WDM6_9CAUD|nr:hypothetical protein UFOVP152_18 [uncultured Caudovirales phage]
MPRRNLGTPNVVQYFDPANGIDAPVPVSDNDPQRPTYRITILGAAPAANPTDLLVLQGAAGVTTRIREIILSGTATSATNVTPTIVRRSSANTGGTSTAQTVAKRDTADAAAASSCQLYTANPTGLGALVNIVDGGRLNLAPAANGSIDRIFWQYSWMNEKGPTLRGASDFFALNFGGAAWPAGGLLDITISLTEE